MFAVKTEELTKYYGKSRGVIDLELKVEKGEFFGFIGPNGAGKSTTIRTLLGLIKPTSGRAEVLGYDVTKDKVSVLKSVGYLPSEAVFYAGMKVRDVIVLSAKLRGTDCSDEAKRLCERLQLDVERKVDELSFGNRKKLGVVCALQHRPELLILDEPTSGLDPLMQREFFDILRERNEDGATVFLSSHILSEIQRNCRRAGIIRDGRLIACDSVDSLSKTSAKRITVHGEFSVGGLEGVRDVKVFEDGMSFLYSGDINGLVKRLGEGRLVDLSVSEPDLEEIFMHYYSDGGVV